MANYEEIGVVILAAGKGTRMQSDRAKVLHIVNGQSMINHVLDCADRLSCASVVVVVGHQSELVMKEVKEKHAPVFALQKELLGTGDAVRVALPFLGTRVGHVVVLCGDVPLIRDLTVKALVEEHMACQNKLTVLAVELDEPSGYGRIVLDLKDSLIAIREEVDASMDEKKINLVNSGIYCIERQFLTSALNRLKPDNAQNEYYLTDLVQIAVSDGEKTGYVRGSDPREVLGVNTLEQLKALERLSLCRDL